MSDTEKNGVQYRTVRAGLANRLILFGATLVIGALLIAVLQEPFNTVMDAAAMQSDLQQAQTGRQWTRQLWEWAPFWIGLLGMISLISGAAFERRAGV